MPERRVAELFGTAMPRIEAFEATFKAALKLSLDQWAQRQAGTLGGEPQFTRGHRVELLKDAIAPLKGQLPPREFKRLAQALSLVFGVEVLIVLKDIWGLDSRRTHVGRAMGGRRPGAGRGGGIDDTMEVGSRGRRSRNKRESGSTR